MAGVLEVGAIIMFSMCAGFTFGMLIFISNSIEEIDRKLWLIERKLKDIERRLK